MTPLATISTDIFSILVILGQLFIVVSLGIFVFGRGKVLPRWMQFFGKRAVLLSFLTVLFGMVSSLFYSRVIGFPPCDMCIWQRWLLYPQIIFFAYALWKNNFKATFLAGMFSVFGLGVASFQYYGQMFNPNSMPCAIDTTVSACAFTPFVAFGYITIPMMSFTAFVLLLTLLYWSRFVKVEISN
jgi:disulfide bond formation protein DsbB